MKQHIESSTSYWISFFG